MAHAILSSSEEDEGEIHYHILWRLTMELRVFIYSSCSASKEDVTGRNCLRTIETHRRTALVTHWKISLLPPRREGGRSLNILELLLKDR